MGGPKFVQFFLPVINALKELGGSGRPSEVREVIARQLSISEQDRTELLEGGAPRFDNQVAWARFYLVKAGLVDSSRRGVWSLSDKGREIESLSLDEALIIFRYIQSEFRTDKDIGETVFQQEDAVEETIAPNDTVVINDDYSYRKKLLEVLLELPASGFERLCQRLLRESGFEQVIVMGRSGDGGIDGQGILQVNPFVSFKVLFQCKRYTVSQVRDFRGAMMGRADKGIILTTGTFTSEAQKEAVRDGVPPIELVHGDKLIDMFENLELGLTPRTTYYVDVHFFREFQV